MCSKLSKKEEDFCRCFVATGNIREAASEAELGWRGEKAGRKILESSEGRAFVEELRKNQGVRAGARAGYERIAYGSIADAVKMLCMDEAELAAAADRLDLFSVAEIKRPKGGGLEIKFFDRLKALEKLEADDSDGEKDFYKALERGAEALSDMEDDPAEGTAEF